MRVAFTRRPLVGGYAMTLPGVYWRITEQEEALNGTIWVTLVPILGHELDFNGVDASELHLLVHAN